MGKNENRAYRYRWGAFILLLLTYFLVFFHRLSPAAVKGNLEEVFGLTAMQYSNLSSAYFYTYVIMQIPSGILADTLGARKTVTLGCAVMAIGSVIFGLAPNFSVLFIARMLVGFGASVIFLSILKIQSTWFEEKEFGMLTGLTTGVGGLGGAMAQGPLAALVALLTWRMSFIAIGVISLILAVILYIVVRNKPEDKGFAPIVVLPKSDAEKPKVFHTLGEIFKSPHIWPIFIMNFFIFGVNFTFTAWMIPFLTDVYGLSVTAAGGITFFGPVVSAILGFIWGLVSDKIRMRKVLVTANIALCALACAGIAFINKGQPSLGMLIFLNILLAGSMGFGGMTYGLAKDLNDPRFAGMSTSVANVAVFLGAAIVPVVFGGMMEKNLVLLGTAGAYQRLFTYFFVFCIIALFASCFILETNCRNRYGALKSGEFKKSNLKFN